jgi:hypothetical protein
MKYQRNIPEPLLAADYTHPALANLAVARCCMAWKEAVEANLAEDGHASVYCSRHVYRQALPPLTGYQNICDFIACVGHGLLLEAFDEKTASKLLYAAQIAMTALNHAPVRNPDLPPA